MHLLIDRYLRGTLADDEVTQFEERLVWDADLVDELDLAESLRDGLRETIADGSFSASTSDIGVSGYISAMLSVPRYAAAASFLLAVMLTVGLMRGPFQPDFDDIPFEATPTEIVPLLLVRGMDVQTVKYHQGTMTVLLLDVVGEYDSYRVTVRADAPGMEAAWLQEDLSPTYPDSLAVSMPGNLLTTGRYELIVEGIRVSDTGLKSYEQVQSIPFNAISE
ncbi:MAG: hypothetical protein OEN22_06010 [Gammaproteobacteria bacterium]|nr:hypothetical protein [Gammaproteobacteria bacterium]